VSLALDCLQEPLQACVDGDLLGGQRHELVMRRVESFQHPLQAVLELVGHTVFHRSLLVSAAIPRHFADSGVDRLWTYLLPLGTFRPPGIQSRGIANNQRYLVRMD
jgi:hypothetical protein